MQWIKSNLNLVVTIVIGLVGITGLVLGVVMPDTAARLQQDQSALSGLSSAKGSNATAIEDARRHAMEVGSKLEKALKDFESIGNHTPILADVFPKMTDPAVAYKFKDKYTEALKQLQVKMHAVEPPGANDFRHEQDAIDNAKMKEERNKVIGVDPTSKPAGGPGAIRQPVRNPVNPFGAAKPNAALTPEELVRENAQVRASIRRAHEGYMYATLSMKEGGAPSFVMPDILQRQEAPPLDQMWYAQMVLWIEQDIATALAAVNQSVADKLLADKIQPWVGNLPVKNLVKITVGNYAPAAAGAGGAAGAPSASFTGRGSGNGVDVITFSLDLYVNPQYLPAVITEMSKVGFYTPLLVNYEAYSPTTDLVGFVYGAQPVVHADMQFEGCFLRAAYEKWMPEVVKTAITEGKAGLSPSNSNYSSPNQGGPGPMRDRMMDRGPGPGPGPGPGGRFN